MMVEDKCWWPMVLLLSLIMEVLGLVLIKVSNLGTISEGSIAEKVEDEGYMVLGHEMLSFFCSFLFIYNRLV
ncbi:hypothetical protein Lalb_Chr08g0241971 [Lupinus albus]|uniref:Uncharacterized protein n=1 Tax=Lupinus albus TaxID=3870 RepID=A0A6A4Q6H5_LUPAL|nr:hypothetical protein Lalb_Chr08g0241971 [Lupinus albus]